MRPLKCRPSCLIVGWSSSRCVANELEPVGLPGPLQVPSPLLPFVGSVRRFAEKVSRRVTGRQRTVTESPNLLPLLIQVLAAFSKADGQVLEEEIDSSLGFLRYDYPEAVYSELRKLFRQALNENWTSA